MAYEEAISNGDYHRRLEISASGLKEMAKSPAHYWAKFLDPNRQPQKPTAAMQFGTVVHTLVLEPETAPEVFAIAPEGTTRSHKVVKDWTAELEAKGMILLLDEEYERALKCRASIFNHHASSRILGHPLGKPEFSIFFEWLGVGCRMRMDWHIPPCPELPTGLIFDLKSTESAKQDSFARSIWNFRYDIQAAFYREGFQQFYGTQAPPPFVFCAFEKESPFPVATYVADDDMTLRGQRDCERLLLEYQRCREANDWPAYGDTITPISLPYWAK